MIVKTGFSSILFLVCLTNASCGVAQSTFSDALSEQEWSAIDRSIERGVQWLASAQQRDGSLPTLPQGQPGITSLSVLAMLSQGNLPDQGDYGENLSSAIKYVLRCQKPNGLLAVVGPSGPIKPSSIAHKTGQTAAYNHAISALMLAEAYATTSPGQAEEIQAAIESALKLTLSEQSRMKRRKVDHGGWRYLDQYGQDDTDLSIIGWQLKFLRSAKNAGFDVPQEAIEDAVGCVRNHFSTEKKGFVYTISAKEHSRAMLGAGILALAHSGMHNTEEAQIASETMLTHKFARYNSPRVRGLDRYHYSAFQCTQAAYQMGDAYWAKFHPTVYRTLISNQNANGSWPVENTSHRDAIYGNAYTTALAVLTLSAPNQLLPIYQR